MKHYPPELSVVIPVHNEAENIGPLVSEIRATLDGMFDYEIIYVDDGSSDDTLQRLTELRREVAHLRVFHHQKSCGQSTAVLTGVHAARAAWIVTLDGDGQNDPADIPALLAARGEPDAPQLICGYRRKRNDTWLKRLSSRVANGVRAGLLKDNTPDTGCGLKLFSRAAFLKLPHFDHMHRFLPALVLRNGGRVAGVNVNHRPRGHGKSNYGLHNRLWVGIIDIVGVMWLQRRVKLPVVTEKE
ncbi:MAG: glycosyltransferase family 2 protein [Gammaproteobacteria bacterium]